MSTLTPTRKSDPRAARAIRKDRIDSDRVPTSTKVITRAVMIGAALYFLFPVWWLLVSSSKPKPDLYSTSGLWFSDNFQLFDNLSRAMTYGEGHYLRWIGNSILYSGVAAILGTLVSVAAGYALSKFVFRGKNVVTIFILGGLLIPAALLTIPLYFVFNSLGIVNTVWAVIIPSIVSPFGVFLGRIYADSSVPDELIEAARVDGASEVRTFFTIVLRILSPALVTIALFIFVATWNNFLLPLVMLNNSELFPVTLGLYTWQSYRAVDLTDIVLVGSLFAVLPLVVTFLGLQRFWRSGLAMGAVKG
ncbi:carbohydrate ABC transporter permease [Timonella senegalensis]|uniref:carbohydrate ABC transporter permease n=1 Tax=Timonella senegalensis TaxID=1465825 RepID=UPI0002F88706|nr:carbohydrate ABC transporter permease [Timonella senegalensis]